MVPGVLISPEHAHRVSTVFHHCNAVCIAHLLNLVHVAKLATHVGDKHELGFRMRLDLGFHIVQVHSVILL